jgi:copper chaperone CopZ
MTCDHCKQAVKGSRSIEGPSGYGEKTAMVQYDEMKTNEAALKKAV